MKIRWYVEIHAHNDFVNVLVGFGVLGLLGYVFSFLNIIKRTPKRLLLLMVLMVLAWFNGLYMYVSFVPTIPIIMVFYRYILSGEPIYDKNKKTAHRNIEDRAKNVFE